MPYKYPRQSKHQVRVGRSFAGLGLFAETPIKKDDFIIEYYGQVITDEEADKKGGKYMFDVSDKWTIDGSVRHNVARYINHSCKPNCEAEIDGKRVFIYAIKNIKPGEELTYDYGTDYFDGFIKPHGCKCGHHHRRKTKRS